MDAYNTYSIYKTKKTGQTGSLTDWKTIGLCIIALALGGMIRPILPTAQAELSYQIPKMQRTVMSFITTKMNELKPLPKSAPVIFNPLIDSAGNAIIPADGNFSIIVPKIGINAAVIPSVDPSNSEAYHEALLKGVAHASTSFLPNEQGVVYLFSHSTNYDWYVKDLNAVFYLLKNLTQGDLIVLVYNGSRYTYKLTEKRIVKPSDISYISPISGKRMLILQTCWPPGSTTERMLVFADLVDEQKMDK